MNRFLEYGIGGFHFCLFVIVAFITFWMGVEKAGYQDFAHKQMERLSQLSFAELGDIRVNNL